MKSHFTKLLTLLALSVSSCEELLPPRDDPQDLLTATVTAQSGLFAFVDTSTAQHLRWGQWSPDVFFIESIGFVLAITNHYDEVLQGPPYLKGKMEVQVSPTRRGTFEFEGGVYWPPTLIQGDMLTLEPGDTLYLQVAWDHFLRPGIPIWEKDWSGGAMTFLGTEFLPGFPFRLGKFRSPPVRLEITGSIQVFEKLPPVEVGKAELTAIYDVYLIWWP